jgi:TPR repeat protein
MGGFIVLIIVLIVVAIICVIALVSISQNKRRQEYLQKLLRLATGGDIEAQFELGVFYIDDGNNTESEKWLKRAADGGHQGADVYRTYLSNVIDPENVRPQGFFPSTVRFGGRDWFVLEVKFGNALLLSKFVLDGEVLYHDKDSSTTWDKCSNANT